MQKLIEGIHEFQKDGFHSLKSLFEQLAHGQDPDTLFITCSDSRIDPNLLTKSQPGDLFILRNAGNIIPPHGSGGGEAATVEYAVAALNVNHIIVCGHANCGAIQALLQPGAVESLPDVASWLRHAETTRRILRENYSHLEGKQLLNVAIQENVLVQLEHLRTLPAVASRLVRGNLHLHGMVYKFETGEVFAYDRDLGQFVPVDRYPLPGTDGQLRGRTTHAI